MKIIQRPRKAGKTTELLAWVKKAERTDSYPFWDRVIITTHLEEAQRLRTGLVKEMNDPLAYNLVYFFDEWKYAHLGAKPVDVAIDNLDMLIQGDIGPVKLATITEE